MREMALHFGIGDDGLATPHWLPKGLRARQEDEYQWAWSRGYSDTLADLLRVQRIEAEHIAYAEMERDD